jgi:hypothetical protein
MRRFTYCLIIGILACTAAVFAIDGFQGDPVEQDQTIFKDGQEELVARLLAIYPQKSLEEGVYVGSEYCIACHTGMSDFRNTLHRMKTREATEETIVNDYNQNGVNDFVEGLDFNTIDSAFDVYKPNAPILGTNANGYTMTIGESTGNLVAVQGGAGWKQRYVLRMPVTGTSNGITAGNYISPVQYNLATNGYVVYHGADWYDTDNMPKFTPNTSAADFAANNSRSYSKGCIGCHSTGIKTVTQDANGEYMADLYPASLIVPGDPTYWDFDHDGNKDLTNVGCESCHGPGSNHILNGPSADDIVNPADLDTTEANWVCAQCHIRPKSVPDSIHGYPYDETEDRQWIPGSGEDFTAFWTDSSGRWPDGKHAKQHHQQWDDFEESGKPAFQFHEVRCYECHNPHKNTANKHQIVESITDSGLVIATSNDNNTLCLACHATHGDFEEITVEMVADYDENMTEIGQIVSAHSHHPYAPERSMGLSRCSKCHMPKVAKSAVNYDINSHTFEPIPPEKTLMYQDDGGMPNSCAVSCHATKVNSWGLGIAADIGVWNDGFAVDTANKLMEYYGPGGSWWDTDAPKSMGGLIVDDALAPGEYQLPEDFDAED